MQYTTPHQAGDFSGGQVVFTGMNATGVPVACTLSWTMPGQGHAAGTLTMLEGSGATGDFGTSGSLSSPGCSVSLAGSSLVLPGAAGNAVNQVSVSLGADSPQIDHSLSPEADHRSPDVDQRGRREATPAFRL